MMTTAIIQLALNNAKNSIMFVYWDILLLHNRTSLLKFFEPKSVEERVLFSVNREFYSLFA